MRPIVSDGRALGVAARGTEDEQTPNRRLGVVILNWNGLSHLIPCLESVCNCQPGADLIVVVDNGSKDGSAQEVAKRFPRVIVLRNAKNLGFATAMNMGARATIDLGCEFVFILNNDTIVEPDALGLLRRAAETPGTEIVNPLITDMNGDIWFSGATFNRWTGAVKHLKSPIDRGSGPIPIVSATGCAMLIRAGIVRELGPFEERYFIYYEDSDLSATIRTRGGQIVLEPAAVVRHHVSADSRKNSSTAFFYYLFTRNRLLFTRRHLPTPWPVFAVRFTAGYMIPRVLALLVIGRFTDASAFVHGYLDYFRGRFGAPRVGRGTDEEMGEQFPLDGGVIAARPDP